MTKITITLRKINNKFMDVNFIFNKEDQNSKNVTVTHFGDDGYEYSSGAILMTQTHPQLPASYLNS